MRTDRKLRSRPPKSHEKELPMSLQTRAAVLSIVAALALMLGVGALSAGSPALETDGVVTVSGHVFYDLNMNGIYDQGEPEWEPEVDVELRRNGTMAPGSADHDVSRRVLASSCSRSVPADNYTVAEVDCARPEDQYQPQRGSHHGRQRAASDPSTSAWRITGPSAAGCSRILTTVSDTRRSR